LSPSARQSTRPSIAIAGAGLIGLSIAWRLAQRDFRVTVFERKILGSEASWAGAGMLAPGGEIDSQSEFTDLAIESRHLYAGFVRELELQTRRTIDYQECGALELAYSAEEWDALQERARRQADIGIKSKTVAKEQVKSFWPRIRLDDLVGAIFYPDDAIVDPRELTDALTSACRQSDVEIRENSAVNAGEVAEGDVAIEGSGFRERYDGLVIAAGAWSSSIQVTNVRPLPFAEPVKGHLIGFRQPSQTCNTILRHGDSYLLQRRNGLLIAGASVEHVGWDRQIKPSIAASLRQQAGFILPHLRETSPSETWIGFRPASDALHVGVWDSKRLYLAYGHYRNGILLAPVTAQNIEHTISANLGKR
jgi:glycine oxidase